MANAESAAKARLAGLKKKADTMGIPYPEDVTEEVLRQAIKDSTPEEPAPAPVMDMGALGSAIGKEMAKGLKAVKEGSDYEELVQGEEIDPADIGEMVTYYHPAIFWIAPAKRVAGRHVKAPIRKIVFELDRGSTVNVGNRTQTRYISSFTTNNKREQAWLETHPFFNKVFFKSDSAANLTGPQVRFAMRFGLHMDALNVTPPNELYRLAAELGLTLDYQAALPVHRTQIANELAARDMAREDGYAEEARKSADVLTLLSGATPQ